MNEILNEKMSGNEFGKVAIIHDWIFTNRGGEKVLEQIMNLFPGASLYYLFGKPEKVLNLAHNHSFHPSFLANIPSIEKIYKHLLPLLPVAVESFRLNDYSLIISSSSCVAKGIIPPPTATHVSYIHSPMRYAWDQLPFYFPKEPSLTRPMELVRNILLSRLRQWDVTSSARVDSFIANSSFVAKRIESYYRRDAQVVYPPVHISKFKDSLANASLSSKKILLFGAWVPYKRMRWGLDLALKAGMQVIAAGQGSCLEEAKKDYEGHPGVEFVISPTNAQVVELFSRSHTLLFPAIEDFGIIPIEAMAAGLWVVAPSVGGTGETVLPSVTGEHFKPGCETSLITALKNTLQKDRQKELSSLQQKHIERFSEAEFNANFYRAVKAAVMKKQEPLGERENHAHQ